MREHRMARRRIWPCGSGGLGDCMFGQRERELIAPLLLPVGLGRNGCIVVGHVTYIYIYS